ncbi:hypothetical protein ABTG91_20305, partial [Acinetobacter baumannii]
LRLRLGGGAALPAEFRALARATPDGRVAIVLDSADDVAACLARLRAAGVTFDDIELVKPDLEDVFIAMMQDAA